MTRPRRGILLLDLAAGLALGSAIVAIVGVIVFNVQRVGREAARQQTEMREWHQLSRQFRRDAHDADRAEFPRSGRLQFSGPIDVSYQLQSSDVLRISKDSTATHYERFQIPADVQLRFVRDPSEYQLVSIQLVPHDKQQTWLARSVMASVGTTRRLLREKTP